MRWRARILNIELGIEVGFEKPVRAGTGEEINLKAHEITLVHGLGACVEDKLQ